MLDGGSLVQPFPFNFPSPVYPFRHKQLNDPGVLVQSEFGPHGLSSLHSSISGPKLSSKRMLRI